MNMSVLLPVRGRALLAAALTMFLCGVARPALASDWYVAPGASGGGSAGDPFGRIQAALQAAQPGDTIHVLPGTYREVVKSVRHGLEGAPIVIRAAEGPGTALLTAPGQVLYVSHAYLVVDGLTIDGQYGAADTVKLLSGAAGFTLRNAAVRRSSRDCIDMVAPPNVLLDSSTIHHCLWWKDGRQDAHAVVAGAVRGLVLRDLDIHTFSGDGLQLDPGRSLPGWDDVLVEGTSFRLAPLTTSENGFPAGVVPGENAIDTKTNPSAPRARLTVRDTTAEGFGPGLINNMAAFNMKEKVHAAFDRVTVSRSEVAFRLRGPGANGGAWVDIRNAVIHDVAVGVRYEDDIEHVTLAYTTFGLNVGRALRAASSGWSGVDVQHTLFLGTTLPTEAPGSGGNLAATSAWFVNAGAGDYRLVAGAPAIDRATSGLPAPATDRVGVARPQGSAADAGAFEREAATLVKPTAPTGLQASATLDGGTATVRLRWIDTSTVESEFQVSRSSDGKKFTRIATLPADTTTYADPGRARLTKYWYRVRAVNAAGRSGNAKTTITTP